MNKQELIDFLKENMRITVDLEQDFAYNETYIRAKVSIHIDNELIATDQSYSVKIG